MNTYMKRISKSFISIILIMAVLTSMTIPAFGEFLLPDSINEQQNLDFINSQNDGLPSDAYLQDATWADNSPINSNIPSVTYDIDIQAAEEPQAEQANLIESQVESNNLPEYQVTTLTDPIEYDEPQVQTGVPYSYDSNTSEKVNLNTGGLVYENIDYVLPGINGLDLVIGRRYNSDEAKSCNPTASVYYYFNNDIPYFTFQNSGEPNNNFNDLYALGSGWSFMFSSIENDKILHLADGRRFSIDTSGSDPSLVDYDMTDLVLTYDTSYSCGWPSSGYFYEWVSSAYLLTYKDGKREYFSSDGQLIAIKDKYDNIIKLHHTTSDGYPVITIIDTLNRVTTISCTNSTTNNHVMTVELPGSISINYTITHEEVSVPTTTIYYNHYNIQSNVGGYSYTFWTLTAYADPMNITTNYSYTISDGLIDAFGKQNFYNPLGTSSYGLVIYPGLNFFVNLTSISHPTGIVSEFTYEPVTKNFGYYGTQVVYRITSRSDGGYNEKQYTYSPNNDSGYPEYLTPPTYGWYWTTVTTVATGLAEKYEFCQHLTMSVTTTLGSKNIQYKSYTYNSNKLPISTTTRTYDYTSNSIYSESIVAMEYDNKGNITASWSPLANGNTSNTEYKTTYTYYATYNQIAGISYKQDANTTVTTTYTLDSLGKHPVSETVRVNNIVKSMTDWTYDSLGNVISEQRYKDGFIDYYLTEYTYQNNAYLAEIKKSGVVDADGVSVTATPGYTAGTIVTKSQYDSIGRLTQTTDAKGNVTQYQYNNNNDLIRVINPDSTMKQYAISYTVNYVTYTDERGTQLRTNYTPLGQEYEIIDVLTGTVLTRKTYDALCRTASEIDFINGKTTAYAYDYLSRVSSATVTSGGVTLGQELYTYGVTSDGLLKTTKTVVGDVNSPSITTTSYKDKQGFEVKTGRLLGSTEYIDAYTYDYIGNKLTLRTALDASKNLTFTTTWVYDFAGRVTREANALYQYSDHVYDALGNNTSATDYSYSVSTFTYDALGRLLKQETPFESTYKAVKKYYYDQAGNVTREQVQNNAPGASASWSKTEYVYNSRNFLTAVSSYDGSTVAAKTQYTYDASGNVLTQTTGLAAANYSTTTYTYDRFGSALTVTDALNQIESYIYDMAGKLLQKTDRNGWVTTYTYDGLGRPLTQSVNTGTTAKNVSLSWTYTLTGNKRTESDGSFTTTYTYDGQGRVIAVNETGGVGKTYTYDIGGNRTNFITSINGTTRNNTSYEYDTLSRLKRVKENGATQATYTYDDNGNRVSLTYANGVTATYSYNSANLVTSVQNKLGAAVQSSFSYTYFLDGNQKTKSDNTGRVTTYTYDGLGRLTTEAESGVSGAKTYNYTYDARGNRATSYDGYSTTYEYDFNNRLLKSTKIVGAASIATGFFYDANGNQIGQTVETVAPSSGSSAISLKGSGWETDEYNGFNQLITGTKDGVRTDYKYKPDGLRQSKTTNGVMTTHVWDGSNIALDIVGSSVVKYVRGINLIYMDAAGAVSYYSYNAHGDVVGLTDASGAVIKSYRYDAFGVEQGAVAGDANLFRYCGEYWDAETGTYYLRARYYNPVTGRFMSEDSNMGDYNDPLSLNLYTYCYNNPVRYFDSTGDIPQDTTRSLARWLLGNQRNAFIAQHPFLAQIITGVPYIALFYAAGFVRDLKGIYHARQDALQQYGGYNSFYDVVFDYATSMKAQPYEFTYKEQGFRFWAWKGDYLNLGAGAELGIYSDSGFSIVGMKQWNAYTSSTLKMSMTLTDTLGNLIASYSPTDYQWWITSFNPFYQEIRAGDLRVTYIIDFSEDIDMFKALFDQYSGLDDSPWTFDKEKHIATLNF